jgi:hypothetical protein
MNFSPLGHTLWTLPDGYIPPTSTGELESHESVCVLNAGSEQASIRITVYFEDRDPLVCEAVDVAGRRTKHIRTSSLQQAGEHIPKGVPYAMAVESDVPVIIQYSRLDATQSANALMTTLGYPIHASN